MRKYWIGPLTALTLMVSVLGGPASGQDDPPSFATPSTGLVDAQLVELDAHPPLSVILPLGVRLEVCLDGWDAGTERPCTWASGRLSVGGPDRLTEGRVARFVEDDGEMLDCAVVACSLVYERHACLQHPFPFGTCAVQGFGQEETPISFQPGRGVGTDGYWDDGETVRVAATGLATESNAFAFSIQCAFLRDGGIACGPTGEIEPSFDGEYNGTIVAQQSFEQDGRFANCNIDICLIGVLVLGSGYLAVDSIGTYREWGPEFII